MFSSHKGQSTNLAEPGISGWISSSQWVNQLSNNFDIEKFPPWSDSSTNVPSNYDICLRTIQFRTKGSRLAEILQNLRIVFLDLLEKKFC